MKAHQLVGQSTLEYAKIVYTKAFKIAHEVPSYEKENFDTLWGDINLL